MTVSQSASLQVLTRALCLEIDGQAFYREAAARTADAKGRQMFLDLADAEALHQRLIQRQIDSLQASGQWAVDARITAVSCDPSQSLFPQGQARAQATGPRADELEALLFAIDKENESYELYRQGALAAAGDPMAEALYRFLMAAERDHFNILMANYEAIINAQHYAGS